MDLKRDQLVLRGVIIVSILVGLGSVGLEVASQRIFRNTEPASNTKPAEMEMDVQTMATMLPKETFCPPDDLEIKEVDQQVLFEHKLYFEGNYVRTVLIPDSVSEEGCTVSDTESFFYKFRLDWSSAFASSGILPEEGEPAVVVGRVREEGEALWNTVVLEECYVDVEESEDVEARIQAERENVMQEIEQWEDAKAAEVAAQEQAEKTAYMESCETCAYKEVERNPDTYAEKKIKISGTVIQVSEGWFDSVTLRVSDQGNIWYVTYVRKEGEARILEGDYITVYGLCKGVKSYTAVMGNQVTVPYISAEYIA